jgi:DNA-binding transcriptional regulator LsrR (DeoR family)
MVTKFDVLQMVKVAKMYYINFMEQEEIAEKLKISTTQISNILAKALEEGIVEVSIRSLI